MSKHTVIPFPAPEPAGEATVTSVLEQIVREGARKLLAQALENEVEAFLAQHSAVRDAQGRQAVVRNGHLPEREIQSGIGPLTVRQPRVRARDSQQSFSSAILPPYLRRLPSVEALIPALYLRGVSSGQMQQALEAILGPQAAGLSASNVVRLKSQWEAEHKNWSERDLSQKQYVYWWVDGIYFNVRLEDERTCILVVMGALADGRKELVAVSDGYRESKLSWQEVLRGLKQRGLSAGPRLAIGDGALGFWAALEEEYSQVAQQRCWVHKTANVLDNLPESVQAHAKPLGAKSRLHEIYQAPTKAAAEQAYAEFLQLYEAKYPKACACLGKDRGVLFTFYEFPAEHWRHIRSTNVIESVFAGVRHRTRQTKGCGSRTATVTMVFKLGLAAQEKWRRINAPQVLGAILNGARYVGS